jgi:putative DNA methylase
VVKAIEGDFPFEYLSEVAEIESWRKELYRPIYHMHKWWARRLGTVFRAVILGAFFDETADIMKLLYEPVDLDGAVVFDPFMGSGTTIGEAHKLGATTIGRDINPVAFHLSKIALAKISRKKLISVFNLLRERVASDLLELYQGVDSYGRQCDVLYYFWVKVLPCPSCENLVDLFSTYIFAKHAYPAKYPQVHIVCPACNHIFAGIYDDHAVTCPGCKATFDPHQGNADRTQATCRCCRKSFTIAKVAGSQNKPPDHRLYAKLILSRSGRKEYLPITVDDLALYASAQSRLKIRNSMLPHVKIEAGHNTQQVLNYGYHYWDQMFNDRQLLALSILAEGIKNLPASPERNVLMLLFSGVLEFNNMFASYKGEGTGAVRHMFSHHILKPERMPLEANVWGTDKSSGSFLNLFHSRILRAVKYKEAPFEVALDKTAKTKKGRKIYGVSPPIGAEIKTTYPTSGLGKKGIYLSCGNSAETNLPTGSVSVVVTDPPFFDNVHYAELADFFYVWQRLYFDEAFSLRNRTTRHPDEVQDADVDAFAQKLAAVFKECYRVLREDGLMIFSYHHSRDEGWFSVAQAVFSGNFSFVQAQPVKAEMSVAAPKSQASSPIDIDVFLICKKRENDRRNYLTTGQAYERAYNLASAKVNRFNRTGRKLSANDIKVVLYSQLLVELSPGRTQLQFCSDFESVVLQAQNNVDGLWKKQAETQPQKINSHYQLTLF